ncbi:MAG TPA: GNAT family N-acetyltransferase [Gaiellaceae bacterium]
MVFQLTMQTRALALPHGPLLLVRPLRGGDVETVDAVFRRLGESSRHARFNGPKPCLSPAELEQLARVDTSHHALVGHVEGDPKPAAIARLVRTGRDSAELAFAVADRYQHLGIGSTLARELLADARAAGITQVTALARADNRAALALMRRSATVLDLRLEGPEVAITAVLTQ